MATRTTTTTNPALPKQIAGVSFLNDVVRAKKDPTFSVSRFPCPYRRQHAVSKDTAAIRRLDRLFAKQRASLRKATGLPYFVDAKQEQAAAALLAWGQARGFTV